MNKTQTKNQKNKTKTFEKKDEEEINLALFISIANALFFFAGLFYILSDISSSLIFLLLQFVQFVRYSSDFLYFPFCFCNFFMYFLVALLAHFRLLSFNSISFIHLVFFSIIFSSLFGCSFGLVRLFVSCLHI